MAVAVSVAYNNSYHSPGYEITVTGLTNYNRLTIERVDLSGEYRDEPVRGATDITISGSTFQVTDFEAPVGKNLAYRVTADGVASGAVLLTDDFTRTATNSWGSSAGGLTWTQQEGTSTNASVNGSVGRLAIQANAANQTMTIAPTLSDFDFRFDVSPDAVAAGAQIVGAFVSGYQDASNYYRWELRFMNTGGIDVLIRRVAGGTLVNLVAHNQVSTTYTANSWWSVRCMSTAGTMQVKVWPQGTTEPTDWWTTATDTTFTSGLIGLQAFTGGANSNTKPVTVSFDNVSLPGSGNTSLIHEEVTSSAVAGVYADIGTAWLKSIGQPALSRRVNIQDFDEISRPARILGEYEVLGRSNKVVLTDVMGGREGSLNIATYLVGGVWESDLTSRDLQALLQHGGTLFLQTAGHEITGEDDMYFEVKAFSRKRIGVIGGELTHIHEVSFVEVDRPATTQESLALRDWQDVIDQNAAWSNVLTNHTTWLDVLQRDL